MNLICEVLEISAEDLLDYGKEADQSYLVLFHLSVISFVAVPIGNIILPLVLWITKKDKVIGLRELGANVLNFQILWTAIATLSIILFAFFKVLHYPFSHVPLYIWAFLFALNIILPIIFAAKTKKGKTLYRYPEVVRFVK